ncbi:Cna protein B-type domain-containing protein [Ruminococcus sp. YRD2003]|uniref:MSCRAMM family protein n=1 Tax=Ruminococcus sp. YRD2003 TaxID=1452313 RepID=UPI0008C1934B|nr:Cna protein B-type domain-containing protein [Ruminococcus flavefaciens]
MIKHSDDEDNTVENLEAGAEFEVYLKSAGSYDKAKETERDYLTTDENGFAQTKDMPYGIYTVHQLRSVDDSEPVADFDVNIAENGKTYEYVLNDKPFKSYIHVTKIDAETSKVIPYEGAGFQIYDSKGELVNLGTDTYYTNSEGFLITPDSLRYGEYTLVEVQAPVGYVLDSTPVPFTVNSTNSSEENAVNVIKVTKADIAQKGS